MNGAGLKLLCWTWLMDGIAGSGWSWVVVVVVVVVVAAG
jgi:hypothetical protein